MKFSRGIAAALGGLLLGLAAPPAVVPMAEWLVLPGLAVWFSIALSNQRALRSSYIFGCVYMAWFSWSVRHVMLPAYLAIVLVGGLYFLLGTAAVRAAPKRMRTLAFAIAVGGTFWLRAMMPEIHYPHGQPCHALWQWPALMRIVTVGGEPLMNALLGLLAATGFELFSSWRVAAPAWRPSLARFSGALGLAGLAVVTGHLLGASVAPTETRSVRVALIEPGYHPAEIWDAGENWRKVYERLVAERLVAPTIEILEGGSHPDLILWPESSLLDAPLLASDIEDGRAALMSDTFPKSSTRLVLGASVKVGDAVSPGALLVELPRGRVLQYQGKQRLVPGGEFLPFVSWLPESWADPIRMAFQRALGTPANCRPGTPRAPMQTSAGVPFGAMLCYDNAFPEPAAAQVASGAEFLVVLSNEAWYRGGAELTQLVAMTVVRALENCVPIVRCTLDGHSVAVGQDGQVLAGLEIAPAPQSHGRILQVSIDRATGAIPPMAWLRRTCGAFLGLLVALGAAHSVWRWVRIRAASKALPAAASSGQSGADSGGS